MHVRMIGGDGLRFETGFIRPPLVVPVAVTAGLAKANVVQALLAMLGRMTTEPHSTFEHPPEYQRQFDDIEAVKAPNRTTSRHGFFEVVEARASRRDFGDALLDLGRLDALLRWTVGKRGEEVAYDFRGAPLRYVPSAGGLCSIDAYAIVNRVEGLQAGSYYYDHEASGLKLIAPGFMARKVSDFIPEQEWMARSAAYIVFVGNTERVVHKYGAMAFKLLLLDAGVAAGHLELVATALELRACQLGGLPAGPLSALLRIDGSERVPLVSVAVGTRGGAR